MRHTIITTTIHIHTIISIQRSTQSIYKSQKCVLVPWRRSHRRRPVAGAGACKEGRSRASDVTSLRRHGSCADALPIPFESSLRLANLVCRWLAVGKAPEGATNGAAGAAPQQAGQQSSQPQAPPAGVADPSRWLSRESMNALRWQVCTLLVPSSCMQTLASGHNVVPDFSSNQEARPKDGKCPKLPGGGCLVRLPPRSRS